MRSSTLADVDVLASKTTDARWMASRVRTAAAHPMHLKHPKHPKHLR